MATHHRNLSVEIAHFNNFKEYIPKHLIDISNQSIQILLASGMVDVPASFEQAIANVGNLVVISEDGRDFDDDSDAKLTTTRRHGKSYSAKISNIRAKKGDLRVQVFEKLNNSFHYFVIPRNAYENLNSIEIPFDRNTGKPKLKNKWWKYQVKDFYELSTVTRQNMHFVKPLSEYKI